MRKATTEEAKHFIRMMILKKELVFTEHIRLILEEIFPFSWKRYCAEKKINPEIKADEFERHK